MRQLLCSLAILMVAAGTTRADTIFIDFESDTPGGKPNGFQSNDSDFVSFFDTNGANLRIANFGSQGDGLTLGIFTDFDQSGLQMVFDGLADFISFEFGNDQPFGSNNVQDAVLTLFNDGTQVGQVSVPVNNNDIMDQSIMFSGATFDEATFFYVGANGQPATLIELVDNFEINQVVPEPASIAIWSAIGAAGLISARRRRKNG